MRLKARPSNTIILNVDERLMTQDLKQALDRSWGYVGDTLVRTHPGSEDEDPVNFIHVRIKYGTHHYLLSSSSEESDENWHHDMERHLENTIFKIGHNNKIFSRNQRNHAGPQIDFSFLETELEKGLLTIRYCLDSNGDIPRECAYIATDIREALNNGTFGEGVMRVDVPSEESFRLQAALAREAKERAQAQEAQRLAQEAAEAQLESTEDQETSPSDDLEQETEDNEGFLEAPDLVEEAQSHEHTTQTSATEESAEGSETPKQATAAELSAEESDTEGEQTRDALELPAMTEEEWQATYGFDEPDFAVDYHVWDIVYKDGTSRAFDSQKGQFVDMIVPDDNADNAAAQDVSEEVSSDALTDVCTSTE